MNKAAILLLLQNALANIETHSNLPLEIIELISASGYENKFFSILIMRLHTLCNVGVLATREKEFELIGSGIYSMHISSRGFNIRILYSFLPDKQPVLLCAFNERAGKSATDYSSYIPVAIKRLKEMEEGF